MFNPSVALELNGSADGEVSKKSFPLHTHTNTHQPTNQVLLRGRTDKVERAPQLAWIMSQSVETRKKLFLQGSLHQQENDKQASVQTEVWKNPSFLSALYHYETSSRDHNSLSLAHQKKIHISGRISLKTHSSSRSVRPCLAPVADIKNMLHAADIKIFEMSHKAPPRHLKAHPPVSLSLLN